MAYLKFVLTELHTFILYNAAASKKNFINDQVSFFSLRISKCGWFS